MSLGAPGYVPVYVCMYIVTISKGYALNKSAAPYQLTAGGKSLNFIHFRTYSTVDRYRSNNKELTDPQIFRNRAVSDFFGFI